MQKKILPDTFSALNKAVKKARVMGFGGYRSISHSPSHATASGRTKTRVSLKSILTKAVAWRHDPIIFDEYDKTYGRGWLTIYRNSDGDGLVP